MKKLFTIAATAILMLVGAGMPAQAAVYKTNVTISAPKYASAGNAVPIDITVCPLATRSSKTCDWTPVRTVTLFANKKKVATGKTTNGLTTINWTPAAAGKYSLTASVAKATGMAAANSMAVALTVSKKTAKTPLLMKYCDENTCAAKPMTLGFDDEYAQMSALLGKSATAAKGRTVYGQYLSTKNQWFTFQTKKSALNSEFGQYSADISLEFDSEDYCTDGDESYTWSFRVLVAGTTKYAPIASPLTSITYECGGDSSGTGSLEMFYEYSDQTIDSEFDSPPTISVSVTDSDEVGYDLVSYYMEDGGEWVELDRVSSTGDDTLQVGADWGYGVGMYSVKVTMYPSDGSESITGDVYTIDIY
jgi:hypothetical protein